MAAIFLLFPLTCFANYTKTEFGATSGSELTYLLWSTTMDWLPWAYQYIVGAMLVTLGIWAGAKNGVWSWKNKRWAVIIVGGWFSMMVIQGLFQYWGTS